MTTRVSENMTDSHNEMVLLKAHSLNNAQLMGLCYFILLF